MRSPDRARSEAVRRSGFTFLRQATRPIASHKQDNRRIHPTVYAVRAMASGWPVEHAASDATIATGHLSVEEPFTVGDPVAIGKREGIVRAVEPILRGREFRLVVQLKRPATERGLNERARNRQSDAV
jgi:hypothetical protein